MNSITNALLNTSEQTCYACHDFLYSEYSNQSYLLCRIIKIAAWALGYLPAMFVYMSAALITAKLNAKFHDDCDTNTKLIFARAFFRTSHLTGETKEIPECRQWRSAFSRIDSKIQKVYVMETNEWESHVPFDNLAMTGFDEQFEDHFDIKEGKATLKTGGIAVLIHKFANDVDRNKFLGMKGKDYCNFRTQQRLPLFLDGGNRAFDISIEEDKFWINYLGLLPPSLRLLQSPQI